MRRMLNLFKRSPNLQKDLSRTVVTHNNGRMGWESQGASAIYTVTCMHVH